MLFNMSLKAHFNSISEYFVACYLQETTVSNSFWTRILIDKSSNFENFPWAVASVYKVHIFWEGHKILQNLHRRFDRYNIGQIYGGDFAKNCGLLRIYELYSTFDFSILAKNSRIKIDFLFKLEFNMYLNK